MIFLYAIIAIGIIRILLFISNSEEGHSSLDSALYVVIGGALLYKLAL